MSKIVLEFTTTACNRPSVLNSTYSSYSKNLKGVDFEKSRLYLNVDPSPDSTDIDKVEEVAKRYFGEVIVNYPTTSNFSAAAFWCFSQVKGDMFFHLEDDWHLTREVDIHRMISKLGNSNLQCILNKKRTPATSRERGEPSFVPSLISTRYWQKYLVGFDLSSNPEYQMKTKFRNKSTALFENRSVDYDSSKELSKDIGRLWLTKNGLARNYKQGTSWSPWINWKKRK
jgi:hypothetical protein